MKAFFGNIWKYLAVFFGGVIAALVYAMKQMRPVETTNVTAGTYVANQEQKIGKMKVRGDGNTQDASVTPGLSERKLKRMARRAKRRSNKELSTETIMTDMGSDDESHRWQMVVLFLSFRGL